MESIILPLLFWRFISYCATCLGNVKQTVQRNIAQITEAGLKWRRKNVVKVMKVTEGSDK